MSGQIAEMALSAAVALLSFAAVGAILLSFARLPLRTFLAPVTFPNAGNIGLPLCLFAFGEEGLALGIGFFAVSASAQLIFGQWLFSGYPTPLPLLKAPIPYAVAIGAIFLATDTQPPEFIYNTTNLLGGFAIPLMTFTLGVSLAKMKVIRFSRTLALSLLRLGMGAGGGFGLNGRLVGQHIGKHIPGNPDVVLQFMRRHMSFSTQWKCATLPAALHCPKTPQNHSS